MGNSQYKWRSSRPTVHWQRVLWGVALLLIGGLGGCARANWHQQLQSEDPLQRIDGAVAAGQARDKAAAGALVDRLEDDDQAVRMYAILALKRIEGTTLGYKYWAEPSDLAHMTQRWRAYLKARHGHTDRLVAASRPAADNHAQATDAKQAAQTQPAAANDRSKNRPAEPSPSTRPEPQEASR